MLQTHQRETKLFEFSRDMNCEVLKKEELTKITCFSRSSIFAKKAIISLFWKVSICHSDF